MTKIKKLPPNLDPVLPVEAGGAIPPVPQGEGGEILRMTTPVTITLTYRAFFELWEIAEARARTQYPRYLSFMPHVSDMWVEAVLAFRNAHRVGVGQPELRVFSEEKAQKARRILAKHEKAEAARKREQAAKARAAKQDKATGTAQPPTSPSKARKSPKSTSDRPRTKKGRQKTTKRASKSR